MIKADPPGKLTSARIKAIWGAGFEVEWTTEFLTGWLCCEMGPEGMFVRCPADTKGYPRRFVQEVFKLLGDTVPIATTR